MLKQINVWTRSKNGKTATCYVCFEKTRGIYLDSGGFCVQSKDNYFLPIDMTKIRFFQKQLVELLIEESPDIRSGMFPTLGAAIRDFDKGEKNGGCQGSWFGSSPHEPLLLNQ